MSTDNTFPSEPAQSSQVRRRFELLRELGRGGFGIVYEAIDRQRNQRVALKVLRRDRPARFSALKGEFRSLRGITHPNLVLLFDLIGEGEDWSFSMELVDGCGFLEYVWPEQDPHPDGAPECTDRLTTTWDTSRGRPDLSPKEKRTFTLDRGRLRSAMAQLALGVDALHRAGKLHRDIKPSNIRMTPQGRLVLLDYGLVADVDVEGRVAAPGGVTGTWGYMSPEQAWGQPVTEAGDWYSVGAVLHEALTGAKPGSILQAATGARTGAKPGSVQPPDLESAARVRQELDRGLALEPPGELEGLCRALLREDPLARPGAEEVLATLGVHTSSRSPTPEHRPPRFVGRTTQLGALTRAYELAASGKTVCARVHGASGFGKSALCAHFLDQAQVRDPVLVVLHGRCYEREDVPYKALDALVDGLADHLVTRSPVEVAELLPRDFWALVHLFGVLGEVHRALAPRHVALSAFEPQDLRRLAFGALRELIARLVDRRPLVLWIDDAQWGDEDSAALLIETLRPPRSPALLVLVSHRDGEPGPFLSKLDAWLANSSCDAQLVDLPVDRLPLEEARELGLALLAGAPDEVAVKRLCDEAGGSPLFMQQLAAAGPMRARASDEPGSTLATVVRAALMDLSDAARSLLEIVAVSSRPVPSSIALRAAGSPQDGLAIVTRLVGQRLLTAASSTGLERLEVYHDKIREIAIAALEPERRGAIHAVLAAAIEAGPEAERDPEVLLGHYAGSGDLRRAAQCALVAAGRAEAALAFVRAAELYGLALGWRLGTELDTPTDNRDLHRKRAKALANCGRGGDAAEIYLHAAEDAPGRESLELRRLAAEQLFASGQNDDALRVLEPLLRQVGLSLPASGAGAVWRIVYHFVRFLLRGVELPEGPAEVDPVALFRLEVAWTASVGLSSANPVMATALVLKHLNLALDVGDRRQVCLSLPSLGALWLVSGSRGGVRRGTSLLEKGESLARQLDDPLIQGMVGVFASTRLMVLGDWPEALARIDRVLEVLEARSTGVRYWYTVALGMRMQTLESLGRLDELRAGAARWEDEAIAIKDVLSQIYASLFTALGLLAADAPGEARQRVDGALARWTTTAGFSAQHLFALRVSVYADLYVGAGPNAHERFLKAWPAMKASQLMRLQSTRLDMLHLRARVALARASAGRPEQGLLREVERDAQRMEKDLRHDVMALASLLRAGAAWIQADSAKALSHLDQAIAGFDSARMELHGACSRRCKGVLIGGEAGRAMVEQADELMRGRGIIEPARWVAIQAPGLAG